LLVVLLVDKTISMLNRIQVTSDSEALTLPADSLFWKRIQDAPTGQSATAIVFCWNGHPVDGVCGGQRVYQ
jgi:hypothetical protein